MAFSRDPRQRTAAFAAIVAALVLSVIVTVRAFVSTRTGNLSVTSAERRASRAHALNVLKVPFSAASVAVSPDGNTVLVGSIDLTPTFSASNPGLSNPGRSSAFDSHTWKKIASVTTSVGVSGISLSRDGHMALIPGGTIGPFRGALVRLPGLRAGVLDANEAITGFNISYDGLTVRPEWYQARGQRVTSVRPTMIDARAIAFLGPVPEGAAISLGDGRIAGANEYYAGGNGVTAGSSYIYIVDTRSGRTIVRIPTAMQSSLAFAMDGSEIIGRSAATGAISAWNCETGASNWTSGALYGSFDGVISSPDGSIVLAFSHTRFAVFDSRSGRALELAALDAGYPGGPQATRDLPQRCAFSPDSRTIYVCCGDGVHVFRIPRPTSAVRKAK